MTYFNSKDTNRRERGNIFSTLRSALTAARRKPEPGLGGTPMLPRGKTSATGTSAGAASAQPLAMASLIRPQVRERWLLPQIAAITPQYIEMTLRGALAGAHVPQWELFNLMEDTWPRLRKNVLELKTAVRNRRPIFEAYREEDEPESPTATERMKLISAAVRKMKPDARADESAYDDMVNDILDAWFKGVSVLEIDWQMTQTPRLGRFLAPRCTRWVSPVSYAWSADLRLCLSNYEQNALSEIPDDKFLIARCKTKSGTILGGALLRPLVWWWCAANFSADWLLNLAQVFGLPFRWANYDPTAAPETVDRISSMLQNMGSAGWAAFPTGTTLELRTEGMKSGNQTPQGDMLDRADKQCDLLVLGQTLTTDTGGMGAGGGSHALGQVHQDVRANVIDAAAKFVSGVLEQQLIPSILRLNFGNDDEAPTLTLAKAEQDDLTAKAAIIAQLKNAGAGAIIPLDWLGKTFGIPKPAEGEPTLAEPKPAAAPNIEHPVVDSIAASDHWNPDLHPRDTKGQFTFAGHPKNTFKATPSAEHTTITRNQDREMATLKTTLPSFSDRRSRRTASPPETEPKGGPTKHSADSQPKQTTPAPNSVEQAPKPKPIPALYYDRKNNNQKVVAPGSNREKPEFHTVREAAIAVARIIAKMNHTRYEYGASIYRKMGPGNTILGYYYSVVEEGPEPPSMQEEFSGRKTKAVSIPEGGDIHDLVGTIHSHPFDTGTREDRDHQRQVALANGTPYTDGLSGAFSYTKDRNKPGDIDSSILQQSHADEFNPLPSERPQEHYLMTAGKQLWMYTPERPVIYDLNIQPERALNKKLFHYVGQIKD